MKIKMLLVLALASAACVHATEVTIDSLTSQVSGIATTASTTYIGLAGVSVGAVVIGMIVYFARKGASLRK